MYNFVTTYAKLSDELRDSVNNLVSLARKDPGLKSSKSQFKGYALSVQNHAQEIRNLAVPFDLIEADALITKAMDKYESAMQLQIDGVNQNDTSKISRGITETGEASDLLVEATSKINELTEKLKDEGVSK